MQQSTVKLVSIGPDADQISADDGVHFSSRRFANRLELQSFSLAPSEIDVYEFGAYDVGLGSADRGNRGCPLAS